MKRVAISRGLGVAFLMWGFVLLTPFLRVTGFSIIEDIALPARSWLALSFIVIGVGLVLVRERPSQLEKHISAPLKITTIVKEDQFLFREAQAVGKHNRVRSEINHLIRELEKGNENCGIGTAHLPDNVPISYLRGRNGARVFYRKGKDGYTILAYADKDINEQKVITHLTHKYAA